MQPTDWQAAASLEEGGKSIRWSLDHRSVASIRWNLNVLDSLRQEIANFEGEKEKEVGGLLFGTMEEAHNAESRTDLYVNLFFPIPCSYLSGSLYHLSETDQGRLQDSVPEWIRDSWSVVGLYRSHRRPGLQLDDEDRKLAVTYLSNPAQIVLLITPIAEDGAVGSLFVRGDGNISGNPVLSFPFDCHPLTAAESKPLSASDPELSERVNEQWVEFENAAADEPNGAGNGGTRSVLPRPYLWAAAACIAGLLCFVFVRSTIRTDQNYTRRTRRTSTSLKAAGELGLKAFTESDHIRVKWDSNTPLFASGTPGLLVVKDGLFQNVIALDSLLLQQGTLTYFPLTASVNFELQVGGAADFTAVTGISGMTTLSAAQQTGKPVSPRTSRSIANSINRPLPNTRPGTGKLADAQMPGPLATERVRSNPESSPLRQAPQQISEFISPPNLNPTPLSAAISLQELPVPAIPRQFILPEHRERVLYLAPQSMKRVSPKAPANVSRLLVSPITIRVKIDIDADGRVVRAESLSRGTALLEYLSTLSVDAARKWLFRPAQRGDQVVESETVLKFNFGPNGS